LLKLPTQSAYIDGGSVQIRPDGTTATHHKETTRLIYFAFDLLFIDGEDLMASPLIERKRRLKALLRRVPKNIYFADHVVGNGQPLYDATCKRGLISRRRNGSALR
jgi:bifunctional non-homologous end joining protein LigD